uniref:Uncharacterized protein n=1 Tax=viral metagenome TaxID=1070528 RepID=A0A6M3KAJ7_9ZZZZ
MTKQEGIRPEWHEPDTPFTGGHWAVWVKTWASTGISGESPDDAPISCAICGRFYVAVDPLIKE